MRRTFVSEKERLEETRKRQTDWHRKTYDRRKDHLNEVRRKRRREDPEYREKTRMDSRASYFKFKEKRAAEARLRRKLFPEIFRQRDKSRAVRRRELNAAYHRRLRDYIVKLRSVPCTDCAGQFHHCVMEFDHARGKRLFCISAIKNRKRLYEEIRKCDVVCANCHKLRTWKRNQQKRKYELPAD